MPRCVRPAFAVRALCLLSLSVLIVPGCKHHGRTVMRPVYGLPAASPALVAPPSTCAPSTLSPGFPEAGSNLTSPPAGDIPGGPILRQSGESTDPGLNPSVPGVPPITAPGDGTTLRYNPMRPARTAARADLRARVAPLTRDPNDLFTPPKADRPWRYIVLHHSANAEGSYAQIDRDHRKNLGTAGCGYHFVIGNGTDSPDGQIEVASRWADQKAGAHCRNSADPAVNDYGIGICLIGNIDDAPPTAKQVEAARALVAYLRDRYQIPNDAVGTHGTIAKTATACPGKLFPAEQILGKPGLAMR